MPNFPEYADSDAYTALPLKYGGKLPKLVDVSLPPGLILMTAGKATGKTLTALAIHRTLQSGEVPSRFMYVMEPRAADTAEMAVGDAFYKRLLSAFESVGRGGVVVVDSLTYLLHRHPGLIALAEGLGDKTFAGGLSPLDIMAVLLYDDSARQAGCTMVATINSELFPVVDKFEGACEGQISLHRPGSFSIRTRQDRVEHKVQLSKEQIRKAAKELGYDTSSNNTSTSSQIDIA